jgi:hypothetical protein
MALRDYFTETLRLEEDKKAKRRRNPDPKRDEQLQWAIQFVSINRMQPLIEALDTDVSTYVTVSEVNAFTSARPSDWT